jgi:hypothetical protein
VTEIPLEQKFAKGKIDRNVAGPEVDKAAIEDFRIRLGDAMDRLLENVQYPARFKKRHPDVKGSGNIGTQGAEKRKNACHLLNTFFKVYNECATKSLGGEGGLDELAQNDPAFGKRLTSLRDLYATFREPSDGAECKPPVEGPASNSGGQSSKAAD